MIYSGTSLFPELLPPPKKETSHKIEYIQERMRQEKEVVRINTVKKQVRKYYGK